MHPPGEHPRIPRRPSEVFHGQSETGQGALLGGFQKGGRQAVGDDLCRTFQGDGAEEGRPAQPAREPV